MAEDRLIISRQMAISYGLIRYFTGKVCKNGHIAERQLSNGSCIECRNAGRRQFHKDHPEQSLKWVKDWERRNLDWVSARNKRWKKENRDAVRAYNNTRKALKRNCNGTHTAADIAEIMLMQGRKCAYCKVPLNKSYHVDHIIPLSKGGRNDRRNLQILCVRCNLSKSKLDPLDFMRSKGKLL